MANPLHLALLSEGTETWNSWVHTHPSVVADVSEAHLDHAHLLGANFIGANLSQATFQGADLRDACLMGTDLSGADLSEAFLKGALLQGGHFSKAVIRWCDIQTIDLSDVNVRAAIFV